LVLVHVLRSASIRYHIVLTTKFRRKVITSDILELIIPQVSDIAAKWGCSVIEMNGEAEHVHLSIICAAKLQSFGVDRQHQNYHFAHGAQAICKHVGKFYWNPSYCVLSTGAAPIEVIRRYIEAQTGAPDPALA
jgi:putative transposase